MFYLVRFYDEFDVETIGKYSTEDAADEAFDEASELKPHGYFDVLDEQEYQETIQSIR